MTIDPRDVQGQKGAGGRRQSSQRPKICHVSLPSRVCQQQDKDESPNLKQTSAIEPIKACNLALLCIEMQASFHLSLLLDNVFEQFCHLQQRRYLQLSMIYTPFPHSPPGLLPWPAIVKAYLSFALRYQLLVGLLVMIDLRVPEQRLHKE